MDKTNVVLIGMPGVGKSTVGVILAKEIGMEFLDTDILIQTSQGALLKDIISENGAEGFMKIEEDICSSVNETRKVIATGGSVCYSEKAMNHLKEKGVVVYLKIAFDELELRLGDLRMRGVVLKPGQTLKTLYDERCPLYEKYADIVIDETGCDIEKTLSKIKTKLIFPL